MASSSSDMKNLFEIRRFDGTSFDLWKDKIQGILFLKDCEGALEQSEYVANRDRRRAFVSGFTGSAGLALITHKEALLWTDGRYFLQATQQLSSNWKLMRAGEDPVVEEWIANNLGRDSRVGVDPWCVSVETAQQWQQAFSKKGQQLVQLDRNLVDEIWEHRPQPVIYPVTVHPIEFTGKSTEIKLTELRAKLTEIKACALVITALDEVAWLYNLRGRDVPFNPVIHSYAVVTTQEAFLYVDNSKITPEVAEYLTSLGVQLRDYSDVLDGVRSLAAEEPSSSSRQDCDYSDKVDATVTNGDAIIEKLESNGRIWINPGSCCYAIYKVLPADQVLLQPSPLALTKSLKHPVELDGFRKSHIRDGAAVVSYLAWLDTKMQEVYGAAGYFSDSKCSNKRKRLESEKLTEVSVSEKLEQFRSKHELFMGPSFETISSVGANAAIIHYVPNADTCAEMEPESIYLCDSGGQYLDGTTDITRTVHFGKPSAHEKSCYTKVLKGHIALDTAVFPNGTNGHALDILARIPLWGSGLDYRHGTGHGVGSYLNVHEGPHLISFRPQARNVALQNSMTVTDEPGYYEDGKFGIRLENVLIVKEASTDFNFADKGYLAFEHITWVPFQKKLIDESLLSTTERDWVDDYHRDCRMHLSPLLSGSELEWLMKATQPLSAH
ncbi:hypothetical protein GOP47_0004139 [Adiantum capillus-veneris]|uniref:Xaa-Pro aminopeptidase n=1 Tax=Adiantum capillus-veneris TaxID=13818 RepID=A0A9D4V6Z7_ADICA|nr:hypothetical protein GOP47_0004139 [Adiantum capillus-veneris]